MSSYFELKSAAGGQFMFNLKAGNHEVVLQGQTCALVETTGVQRVQVVYGCPTVVLR